MKLLIADDEQLVRFSIRDILAEIPIAFDITEVGTGTAMVEEVKRIFPDIALVDIRMPGISGLKAIEELSPISRNTKWIILSGYSEFEYGRSALRLGVIDYLLKPVDPEELKKTIGRTLDIIASETRGEPGELALHKHNDQPRDMPELLVRHAQIVAGRRFCEAVGVAQIAAELKITPNYLSSMFKKYTGESLTAYLTNLRLEEAHRRLKEPGISVKEVSSCLGYTSSRHFARLFREKYGLSPSDYQLS
ncbi:response regulator [Marispirochaeta sp.]|jgi:two-component system, response regulator YesN|uniref:response regulator transcription factor n=1 Tax=Marispirochaeta sp. TaxID=2038653 RepID=UPI0029C60C1A|nr:response regulator [Marispirochaeta sp.]